MCAGERAYGDCNQGECLFQRLHVFVSIRFNFALSLCASDRSGSLRVV